MARSCARPLLSPRRPPGVQSAVLDRDRSQASLDADLQGGRRRHAGDSEANGRITVEAGDGDEIEVSATRVAKAPTEEAAKAALEEIQIKEAASADRVEIDSTAAVCS